MNKHNILGVVFYIEKDEIKQGRIDNISWCSVHNSARYKLDTLDTFYESEVFKTELDAINELITRTSEKLVKMRHIKYDLEKKLIK